MIVHDQKLACWPNFNESEHLMFDCQKAIAKENPTLNKRGLKMEQAEIPTLFGGIDIPPRTMGGAR